MKIFIGIIMLIFNFHLVYCIKPDGINEDLNTFRKEKGKNEFVLDTLLNSSISELYSNKILCIDSTINKDSIRKYLRINEIYDYNIELFNVKLSSDKKLDIEKQVKKNKKFEQVLNDSLFNNMGYLITPDSNSVCVFFSQNFMEFNPVEFGQDLSISYFKHEGKVENRYYIVSGKIKNKDNLFINDDGKIKNVQQNRITKTGKQLGEGEFEFELPLSQKQIEIFDSAGNIKAIYLVPLYIDPVSQECKSTKSLYIKHEIK